MNSLKIFCLQNSIAFEGMQTLRKNLFPKKNIVRRLRETVQERENKALKNILPIKFPGNNCIKFLLMPRKFATGQYLSTITHY